MEAIRSWFEDLILGLPFVVENVRNSYQKGQLDGSGATEIAERNDEMLALIKRIEGLKLKEFEVREEIIERRAQKLLAEMLTSVDLTKIVSLDKQRGFVYIGGERVGEGRLGNLKSETEFLLNSDLWSLLYETPKELAQRAMFVEGENAEKQLAKGRTILYTLQTQKNILDVFAGFIPSKQ